MCIMWSRSIVCLCVMASVVMADELVKPSYHVSDKAPQESIGVEFHVPAPQLSQWRVDTRNVAEPVNRRVMGACLIYPPFTDAVLDKFADVLDGTSGRAWVIGGFGGQEFKLNPTTEHWQSFSNAMERWQLSDVLAFVPKVVRIDRKARYVSVDDNNLDPVHMPDSVAQMVKWINKTPHPGFPDGYGIRGWEVWNEPQFKVKGQWPAEDMARYAIDISRAIRKVDPAIEVGVPLHEADMQWNETLMRILAEHDPFAVDFFISHPYGFAWFKTRNDLGMWYSRAADAQVIGQKRVKPKMDLILRYGHGRWRLVCTEWTLHPYGYDSHPYTSQDTASALNVPGMLDVFWNLGVDSAQFFDLLGRNFGHFHLAYPQDDQIKLTLPGEVFSLYGRYFRGDRLNTQLDTSQFATQAADDGSVSVPLVIAHAAYDHKNQQLVLMMSNRHMTEAAPLEVKLTNVWPTGDAKQIVVTAADPRATLPVVQQSVLTMGSQPDPSLQLQLPPHSVTALILPARQPADQTVLLEDKGTFIGDWFNPATQQAHLPTDSGFTMMPESTTSLETWVFYPVERQLTLHGAGVGACELLVNGQSVSRLADVEDWTAPLPAIEAVTFACGWNKLTVKSSGAQAGFWLALPDDPALLLQAQGDKPNWPHSWVITADQATFATSIKQQRDQPQGSKPVMELTSPPPTKTPYIHWSKLALPPDVTASDIQAQIIINRAWVKGDGEVWLCPVQSPWDEASLVFAHQPHLGESLSQHLSVALTQWVFEGSQVDDLVKQWLTQPSNNFGIALQSSVDRHAAVFSDDHPKAPMLRLSLKRKDDR